jgi:predicted ribosome quality control (RQC) complex YloA/Tae2 family protein
VREIKETNQFVLPESIRRTYPILYGTNLFAEVKLLIVEEMKYMNQLKDTLNKKLELEKANTKASSETLITVKDTINNIVEQLIMYKKTYIRLDKEFASELKQNQTRSCCVYINPMGWFKV